jgi:hypothetical protein
MTSAELPTRAKGADRHPWDWYVEEQWVTHRLLDFVAMDPAVTYLDPACGQMHIPQALAARGLMAFGTDLFQRTEDPRFMGEHNFLGDQRHMLEASPALSIVMNAPYSCQGGKLVRGLAERFIRRALGLATHQVAALLPLKWLASQGRCRLFAEHQPSGIYILCERPSMPPGNIIRDLADRAYRNGKIDYMWVVWDKHAPALPHAPTFWIPPRPKLVTTIELAEAA